MHGKGIQLLSRLPEGIQVFFKKRSGSVSGIFCACYKRGAFTRGSPSALFPQYLDNLFLCATAQLENQEWVLIETLC
ncbi:MAG: hypothetical protein E6J44_04355 [Chloroflexi bacterium]|nr:MAG: hypothetical protein E6J44_04355 [Chloroflexota bacterium]